MAIEFGPDRWRKVRENYDLWWKGELDRPLIDMVLYNRSPDRPCPDAPQLTQQNCTDFSLSVDDLVDRFDWDISQATFLADSYPRVNMHMFGPGVAAAFAGAILDNSSGQVWFHSPWPDRHIKDIHLEYDPNNIWLARIKEFCVAAMKRWQGQVLVTMTDLGGTLDIVQSFVTAERLLTDLYDEPAEVNRLIWEVHELWHRYYDEIHNALLPINPGYSDHSGIYCESPSYVLQCDFSYMIGPNMFRKFVVPELSASCGRLYRSIYHMDGVGQLPHLDHLLSIPDLDVIQWVPGEGGGRVEDWPDVRRKIGTSGKKAQTYGSLAALEAIIEQAGSPKNIQHIAFGWPNDDEAGARRKLAEFGIKG